MQSDALHNQTRAPARARQNWRFPWRQGLRHRPLGALSAVLLCGCIVVACLAPYLAPYDPAYLHLNARGSPLRLQAPNATFVLGTDPRGRDVLSRMIYGTRVSMLVGFCSVALGTVGGTLIGLVSGYREGRLDQGLQRIVDTLMAFPGLVLALVVLAIFGQSLLNVVLVIGLVITPGASRVVRETVLTVKHQVYIEAALAAGSSSWRLLRRHIVPHVLAPMLVVACVWLAPAIVMEAALSFLGFGTPPPIPTWGGMLRGEGRRSLETAPYLALFPGLAISIAVLAANIFGEAVRDLLAPCLPTRLEGRAAPWRNVLL